MIAETIAPKYNFRLQQTAKGYWYTERLEVSGDTEPEVLAEMRKFATDAMALLDTINKGIQ